MPVDETIETTITVDTPVGLDIPVNVRVPLKVDLPVSLTVEIPINETIPISVDVPVELDVPVRLDVASTEYSARSLTRSPRVSVPSKCCSPPSTAELLLVEVAPRRPSLVALVFRPMPSPTAGSLNDGATHEEDSWLYHLPLT